MSASTPQFTYRSDIDGLRGIAVLLVMGFHAKLFGFEGGFLGVDIFFVISGYLITSQLIMAIEAQRFTLAGFYLRRMRRLLPALMLVMICCLPFAYAWMLPSQLKDFSQSLLASTLFISNILFWHESGYFQADSLQKPLLHTWSLAVEEQFYLFFPLLFIGLWRLGKRRLVWGILSAVILSIGFSEWAWRTHPSLNYYLPFSRVWELFTGAVVALWVQRYGLYNHSSFAYLGLGGLSLSIVTYQTWMPSPSLYTLIPVMSTSLLIICGDQASLVYRCLSHRWWVGLGLISYSVYLWHQPLLALAQLYLIQQPLSILSRLTLLGLSIVLAYLSWRFVEIPFRRNPRWTTSSRLTLAFSLFSLFLMGSIGAVGHFSQGLPRRGSSLVQQIEEIGQTLPHPCPYHDFYQCTLGTPNQSPHFALLGDSHASMYAHSFDRLMKQRGEALTFAGDGWCVPLLHFTTDDFRKNNIKCAQYMSTALKQIAQSTSIHTVFLAAEWSHYVLGQRYNSAKSAYRFMNRINTNPEHNATEFSLALHATLTLFNQANKKVVLIEPVPEYIFHVPYALAGHIFRRKPISTLGQSETDYLADHKVFFNLLKHPSFRTLSRWPVTQVLCSDGHCTPYNHARLPLYSDTNHLSDLGAELVVKKLSKP